MRKLLMIPSCGLSIFAVASKEMVVEACVFNVLLNTKGLPINYFSIFFFINVLLIIKKLSIICKRFLINYASFRRTIIVTQEP